VKASSPMTRSCRGLNSHRLKLVRDRFSERRAARPCRGHRAAHLGASTREAEDNSAIMVVDQLRDYLEHGNLQNAVNFPDAAMAREAPYRLAIANANVPDMLGAIFARARAAQDQHPQHAEQV